MLLYEAPGSPYAQKIKIALREKAIPFDTETPASLGTGRTDDAFGLDNPRAEVPLLVDGATRIFDSTIILEYIEERWPDPPLLPRDPAARAAARMIEDVCDTQYEAVTWGIGEITTFGRAAGTLADTMRKAAARQTALLQDWLAARLGEASWFGGATFGWADAAVAPLLHRSVLTGFGPAPGSKLAAWYARLIERPSVATTFAEYAAAAARMPATIEAFRSGAKVRQYRDHRLEWMLKSGGIDIVLAGLRDGSIRFTWPNPG
ncbi:MAG: glutathione S-transferase family protein [Proteobacteria bacterium]|nr:glutathione S-transferase family protein [Pseudomonadota bacterium]